MNFCTVGRISVSEVFGSPKFPKMGGQFLLIKSFLKYRCFDRFLVSALQLLFSSVFAAGRISVLWEEFLYRSVFVPCPCQTMRTLCMGASASKRLPWNKSGTSNNPSNKLRTRAVAQDLEQDCRTRLRTRSVAQDCTRLAQGILFI